MILQLNRIKLKKLYFWLLIITLSSFTLYLFTHKYIKNNYFILVVSLGCGLALCLIYILLMRYELRCKADFFNILFLIFLIFFGIYFRDMDLIVLGIMALSLFFLSGREIIKVYGISQLLLIFFLLVFALFRMIPLFTYIQNGWMYEGNVHVLNFGLNKNLIGLIFLNISIYILSLKKVDNRIKYFLSLIIGLVMLFLVKDRTVALVLFSLIFFYILTTHNDNISKLCRILIILLPIVLIVFSLYLSFNYGKENWVNNFNAALSGRVQYWNYFWNTLSLSWWPQSLVDYFNMYDLGVISTVQYPVDGFYSLGVLKEGILIFTIFIFVTIYTLYNLTKNYHKNKLLLISIVALLLFCLSENIALSYGYLCYLFPYVLDIFSRKAHDNY